jgi:hypothetical protein
MLEHLGDPAAAEAIVGAIETVLVESSLVLTKSKVDFASADFESARNRRR